MDLSRSRVMMVEDELIPRENEWVDEQALLRRGLGRSRLAAVAVLMIAAVLASAAVLAAWRSERNARQAHERLWESLVSLARAERSSGVVGGRTKALAAIAKASAMRPTAALRDEAIAALALVDLEVMESWVAQGAAVAFSPDLREHAECADGYLRFYESSTSRTEVAAFANQPPFPERIEYSPTGDLLAIHHYHGELSVWDAVEKRELWRAESGSAGAPGCAFSFDAAGKLAVCAVGDGQVVIYDGATGREQRRIEGPEGMREVAMSENGRWLAMAAGSTVAIQSLMGHEKMEFRAAADVTFLRWHPDHERLAVGCYWGQIALFDSVSGTECTMDDLGNTVDWLTFSPNGRYLVGTGWDGITRVWDADQGGLQLKTSTGRARRFNRGGDRLAFHQTDAAVGIWKFTGNSIVHGYGPPAPVGDGLQNVEISPDKNWLVAHEGKGSRSVWDLRTGRLVSVDDGGSGGSRFTSDGAWLFGPATLPETGLRRWAFRVEGGKPILGDPELVPVDGRGDRAFQPSRFGPNGRDDATFYCYRTREAVLLETGREPWSTQTLVRGLPGEPGIARIVGNADMSFVVATFWKGRQVQLWDLAEGVMVRQLDHFGGDAAFVPGGAYLCTGSRRGLEIWETGSWVSRELFPRVAAASGPTAVRFTFDGRFVSYEDTPYTVRMIDLATLGVAATFSNPGEDRIFDHGFSDDGELLAMSTGTRLLTWDLVRLREALAGLGLRFGEQVRLVGTSTTGLTPARAAAAAAGVLVVACLFGFYILLYQRRLIRRFDVQQAALQRTRHELSQAEKMKALGTLSAGVAHDFKNLLSVIRLSNDLIRRDAGERDDLLEEVDAIAKAVAQGNQVVRAMLGYSRDHGGEASAVDLGDVVAGTVSLLGQQFLSGIQLKIEIDETLPPVDVPKGALEQILLNLVINASEAMNRVGELGIRVAVSDVLEESEVSRVLVSEWTGARVSLEVQDSGSGISPENLTRIFEPFFTTKSLGAEKGTGLGLATVYKIAKDNGLGLLVASCWGQGTRFRIEVPVRLDSTVTDA